MYGSTFGNILKISTWGESHGAGLGVVVDGCPAGLPLSEEDVAALSGSEKTRPVPIRNPPQGRGRRRDSLRRI